MGQWTLAFLCSVTAYTVMIAQLDDVKATTGKEVYGHDALWQRNRQGRHSICLEGE